MPKLSNWIPSECLSGAIFEQSSLLGQLFALSPLAPSIPETSFKKFGKCSNGEKSNMINSIQKAVHLYQNDLSQICRSILNSGTRGQRGVLDWFRAALSVK